MNIQETIEDDNMLSDSKEDIKSDVNTENNLEAESEMDKDVNSDNLDDFTNSIKYDVIEKELIIDDGNKSIYGKVYYPEGEGVYPTIIFSHGYNGINLDFTNDCRYFAENGYIAYAYDFCGGSVRSKSSGKSTDMTIFTEKSDLLTVFDYIQGMEQVNRDHIYLFGGSQGGLVTALAAEELLDKVDGMILYFPAFNIPNDWRKTYSTLEDIPETNEFWGLTLGKNFFASIHNFNTFDEIGTFTKDVLIIHGDKDFIVPIENSIQVQELYKNIEIVTLVGEGHGFTPTAAVKAREHVLDFIKAIY